MSSSLPVARSIRRRAPPHWMPRRSSSSRRASRTSPWPSGRCGALGLEKRVRVSARRTPPRRRGQLRRCRHGGNRRNAPGQRAGPRGVASSSSRTIELWDLSVSVTHRFPPCKSWAAFVYGFDSSSATVISWFSERWSTLLQARVGVRPVFPGQDLQRRRIPPPRPAQRHGISGTVPAQVIGHI